MHIHCPTTLPPDPVFVPSADVGASDDEATIVPIENVTVVDKLYKSAYSSISALDVTSVNDVYATPR